MNSGELKAHIKRIRSTLQEDHAIRLHRAASWYGCAEQYRETDPDVSFITSWIALNACYSIDDDPQTRDERTAFNKFSESLVRLDKEKRLYDCLWKNYHKFVKELIKSKYQFPPFWRSLATGDQSWQEKFAGSKKLALNALGKQNVPLLLSIVFDRLYVLRNQLIHGGSTHGGGVNRDQVIDGRNMLLEIVPLVIELMCDEDAASEDWGKIQFPVVD